MTPTHDSDGHVQYRSRGGRVAFGVWCLVILAGVIGAAVSAAVTGEPPWIFVAAAAGLLALRGVEAGENYIVGWPSAS
jgi:hypothetical protein